MGMKICCRNNPLRKFLLPFFHCSFPYSCLLSPPAIVLIILVWVRSSPDSSPTTLRSLMTTSREQVRSISSVSEEMKVTLMPSPASFSTSFWISTLVPTSIPLVGSSRIRYSGWVRSHLARDYLLLITAGQRLDGCLGRCRLDIQQFDVFVCKFISFRLGNRVGRIHEVPVMPG